MGNMVYSLVWVMQDLYHQPRRSFTNKHIRFRGLGFRVQGLGLWVQGLGLTKPIVET